MLFQLLLFLRRLCRAWRSSCRGFPQGDCVRFESGTIALFHDEARLRTAGLLYGCASSSRSATSNAPRPLAETTAWGDPRAGETRALL